jgi:hypothetical protein
VLHRAVLLDLAGLDVQDLVTDDVDEVLTEVGDLLVVLLAKRAGVELDGQDGVGDARVRELVLCTEGCSDLAVVRPRDSAAGQVDHEASDSLRDQRVDLADQGRVVLVGHGQ